MLRREPWRVLFPLGALLAWAGVVPWLLFALRLRGAYQPVYATLGYRAFFHPIIELEGFAACFAAGLVFALFPRPPAAWQVAVAALLPVGSTLLGAAGLWEEAQATTALLLVLLLAFAAQRLPRPLPLGALWLGYGLLAGVAGAELGELARHRNAIWLHEVGRDLVTQGLATGFAVGIGRFLRGEEPRRVRTLLLHLLCAAALTASFFIAARHLGFALRALVAAILVQPLRPKWEFGPENLHRGLAHVGLWLVPFGDGWAALALTVRRAGLHVIFIGAFACLFLSALSQRTESRLALASAAALFALSTMARAMVELDPGSFHLWMGISAASFLLATVVAAALGLRLSPAPAAPTPAPRAAAAG